MASAQIYAVAVAVAVTVAEDVDVAIAVAVAVDVDVDVDVAWGRHLDFYQRLGAFEGVLGWAVVRAR